MWLKIAYWAGLIAEIFIRAPFAKSSQSRKRVEQRISRTEQSLLALLTLGGFLLPLLYTVTPWLNFANYDLPDWMGWLGVLFLSGSLYLFARGHIDLKSNWSQSLEIYDRHDLITSGIYSVIRHPMYASQWLMVIAQLLLLQNGIAGPAGLVVFIPFYFLRSRAEEKMMLEAFGEQYRRYMETVGGVFPKLPRHS